MFLILAVGGWTVAVASDGEGISLYGAAAFAYLGLKLVLSLGYRPEVAPAPDLRTAAIVPFYNEDSDVLASCIRSLCEQTRPPDSIWVVDDGSTGDAGYRTAKAVAAANAEIDIVVHREAENRGKRQAQAWALRRADCEVVVTVDSDTVLDPRAIEEGLRCFADPQVVAATGNVTALNEEANLLTRLTSIRYANAFLWERAAYSTLGSVLCCCGSLAFFRQRMIAEHLDDYTTQTFLGVPVSYGDDRRLTNYALQEGRVVFQDSSVGACLVPERVGHFARQQTRWNKSFFRESIWLLSSFPPWSRQWWLCFGEIASWTAFSIALTFSLAIRPLATGELPSLWWLALLALLAYARSVRYLGSQRTPLTRQWLTYTLAPLYGVLHVLVQMPLRGYSLLTLRSGSWGTRGTVEVATAPPAARAGGATDASDAPSRGATGAWTRAMGAAARRGRQTRRLLPGGRGAPGRARPAGRSRQAKGRGRLPTRRRSSTPAASIITGRDRNRGAARRSRRRLRSG